MLVFMIELRQADSQLAAARTRRSDHHQRTRRLDVIIFTEAFVADDQRDVGRISGDRIMQVNADAQLPQTLGKHVRSQLPAIPRDDHAAYQQPLFTKRVDEAQNFSVIGDVEIVAHLVVFDIAGIDGEYDLSVVFECLEHVDLAVRQKPGSTRAA